MANTHYPDDAAYIRAGALIDDDQHDWHPDRAVVNGLRQSLGLVPRDFEKEPMYAAANEYPDSMLLDEKELKEAFEQQKADRATLWDLRNRANGLLDSLDQNGKGLCWAFSTTKAIMYARAMSGFIGPKLSGWWIAGRIMSWRDQGGWGEASMKYAAQFGIVTDAQCPAYNKKYDTPENNKLALEHLVSEWWETSEDKDKRTHQMLSAMALGIGGGVFDSNQMGHSMSSCYCPRFVSLHDMDIVCDNSWGHGDATTKGTYLMKGSKARPDGYVICRVSKAIIV